MRRSPGGIIENSSRKRPLDPPLSATVTMAVIFVVTPRSADNVAAKPWPPPSATTRGLRPLIHDQHRDEWHAQISQSHLDQKIIGGQFLPQ